MAAVQALEAQEPVDPRALVLVVDDEVLIRALLAETLRQAGFEVLEAANADEALVLLRAAPAVDVMVTDVRMPGALDGLALATRARAERPGLKIVVTSGHHDDAGASAPGDAFLAKPYSLEALVARVRRLTDAS